MLFFNKKMLLPITKKTKKRRENKFIRLMFWPGHSPDLNPIWFHIFKEGIILSCGPYYQKGIQANIQRCMAPRWYFCFDITGLRTAPNVKSGTTAPLWGHKANCATNKPTLHSETLGTDLSTQDPNQTYQIRSSKNEHDHWKSKELRLF